MVLNYLDWTIIVVYFGLTLAVGVGFSSRAGRSLSEYFVSGRSLPWWLAGTSMVATTFAADTPLAVTGLMAKNGLAGNWFWWSFALGGMFTVFVYSRMWRRAEVLTDVELVEIRYSGQAAAVLRGVRAVYVALIVNPIIIGWVTGAMLTILKETVLVDADVLAGGTRGADWLIILVCLSFVGVYCSLSGLWGVTITDFLQFFLAMTGCILLAIFAVREVGGMQALQDQVTANFGGGDQAFRFLPDFRAEDPWMPLHIFMIFLFVQWWATWYPGAEPGGGGYIVQRMASCKDERHALLATLWYQVAHYCVRPWPWLLVAFVSLALYPEIRQMGLGQEVPGHEGLQPDVGFVWVMRDVSPAGLRGLMLVTFFAAFMSTISTQMNWGASYLIRDFYQRFIAPDASERQLTRASRIVSLGVLLVGGVFAYAMRGYSVDDAWKLLVALGAGTGAVFMLRWFWWRINAWSEIVAMIASFVYFQVSSVLQRWLSQFQGNDATLDRIIELLGQTEVQTLVVAVMTIATWLVATYATRPEDDATLIAFYRKVRPGGPGWKPIAKKAPEVQVDQDLGWSICAALLGATLVYLTLPGIGWLLFGSYLDAFLSLSGAVVCGLIIYWMILRRQSLSGSSEQASEET